MVGIRQLKVAPCLKKKGTGQFHTTTIHYLKASESPEILKTCWNNYCIPGIKSYVIPGDHFSILKKPIVTQSAEIFSKIVK
jgi:thioesterase domain-containing protein